MPAFRDDALVRYWHRVLLLFGLLLLFFVLGGKPWFIGGPLLVVPAAAHQYTMGARPRGLRHAVVLVGCTLLVVCFVEAVRHLPDPLVRFFEGLVAPAPVIIGAVAVSLVFAVSWILLVEAKRYADED